MNTAEIIKEKAIALGFDLVNIIPIAPSQTIDIYAQWLTQGYAGQMEYLHKHFEKKQDPRKVMPETLSLISLVINYHTLSLSEEKTTNPAQGRISSYAWGTDYHLIVREKLEQLRLFIEQILHDQRQSRVYVDTGPILEREYAQRAGLGWFGKNSMLINWKKGSWFFLAEVLLDIELDSHVAPIWGDCGNCTKCLEACPTNAIMDNRTLDARQCISYLTIELKGTIPKNLRPHIGNLIFGCDICQEVCPWNRKAPISQEVGFQPRAENIMPDLIPLMHLSPEQFNQRFKNSTIKRTKRRGLLRNVAIALGNWGDPQAIPALKRGLEDEEILIKTHSAWALGQISHPDAKKVLEDALKSENEVEVIEEIQEALLLHDPPTFQKPF